MRSNSSINLHNLEDSHNRHWYMKNNERIEKANLKQKIKVKER